MELVLQLPEDLQCPICYNWAVPPVQTCVNGHIVCGLCRDKVHKCSLCRGKLVNFAFINRILARKEVAIPGKVSEEGCSEVLNTTDKTDTIAVLQFSPEDLQCPICWECAVPPIQTCKNGHIVCGVCSDKVDNCASCRAHLFPMLCIDRILREKNIQLPCRYLEDGCSERIKTIQMKDHLALCGYRPTSCYFLGKHNCKAKLISLNNFLNHLEKIHKMTLKECNEGWLTLNIKYRFWNNEKTEKTDVGFLKFDEKYFFIHRFLQEETQHFTVGVLGDQEVAGNYYCHVKATNLSHGNKKKAADEKIPMVEESWRLKVFSRNNVPSSTLQSKSEMATLRFMSLNEFFQKNKCYKPSMEFEWKVSFKICFSKNYTKEQ